MAQNVTVAGASFSDVPSVVLPKTGGGTATFVDTSDADAVAGNIVASKTAYVNGTKITGSITSQSASGNTTLTSSTTTKSYAAGYYANAHGATVSLYTGSVT